MQLANKSRSNQQAIAAAGGIPLLVNSLTVSGGGSKDSNSAIAQCSLAASAIWKLVENNAANKVRRAPCEARARGLRASAGGAEGPPVRSPRTL